MRGRVLRLVAAACVLVVAATVVVRTTVLAGEGPRELPAHPSIERDGLRYEFNALTGRETLLDITAVPPREVVHDRDPRMALLRKLLCESLRIDDLATLVDAHREQAEGLRRLGYL